MLKEIIRVMKVKYILLSLFVFFISSCGKQEENKKIMLILDSQNSSYTDKRFLLDSILFIYEDSIRMFRYEGSHTSESVFFKNNESFFELRERFNEIPDESFGKDTILTFDKKHTTFIFKSSFEFVPLVFYYAIADNKYTITKDGDMYVTIKQSLVDSTYTEKFYYDEKFRIKKFVNTYQDNICIYIPK
jgi:hypothetical protein